MASDFDSTKLPGTPVDSDRSLQIGDSALYWQQIDMTPTGSKVVEFGWNRLVTEDPSGGAYVIGASYSLLSPIDPDHPDEDRSILAKGVWLGSYWLQANDDGTFTNRPYDGTEDWEPAAAPIADSTDTSSAKTTKVATTKKAKAHGNQEV